MSLANYTPRSRYFKNANNWRKALAWVERERERLREYALADCGGVGNRSGLSAISLRVAGPAETVQVRGNSPQRAAQVRRVYQAKDSAAGILESIL